MHNRKVVMTRCAFFFFFCFISYMPILPLYLHKNRHSVLRPLSHLSAKDQKHKTKAICFFVTVDFNKTKQNKRALKYRAVCQRQKQLCLRCWCKCSRLLEAKRIDGMQLFTVIINVEINLRLWLQPQMHVNYICTAFGNFRYISGTGVLQNCLHESQQKIHRINCVCK